MLNMKNLKTLLKDYAEHVAERATKGIPPLPLNAEQTNCITKLLEQDRIKDETLFYNDMFNMTWEEAREKYLTDVGR